MAKTTKLSKEVEALKKFKEENNMTLEELGNDINIQGTTLSQYFNGTVQPLPNTLAKIQMFLNQRIFTLTNVDGTQYVDSR
ncbi:helix-turn-helix domain-containing protein [Enterococcus cecorum]|nr:helix-turn-helix transcriptional regulator [Enterococcus cecorum]MDZ5589899.1 helix-turn-helix transcriptional regulator [Enterococcus cecorum]